VARAPGSLIARVVTAAAIIAAVAFVVSWRSSGSHEVNAVITGVHCRWSPLRLGDVEIGGKAHNPSSRSRDFSLTPHLSLPGLGDQTGGIGDETFWMPAGGAYHFWIRVTTSPHSKPGGPIGRCGASARSYTPSGDD
jgi:hypothetical protein